MQCQRWFRKKKKSFLEGRGGKLRRAREERGGTVLQKGGSEVDFPVEEKKKIGRLWGGGPRSMQRARVATLFTQTQRKRERKSAVLGGIVRTVLKKHRPSKEGESLYMHRWERIACVGWGKGEGLRSKENLRSCGEGMKHVW